MLIFYCFVFIIETCPDPPISNSTVYPRQVNMFMKVVVLIMLCDLALKTSQYTSKKLKRELLYHFSSIIC